MSLLAKAAVTCSLMIFSQPFEEASAQSTNSKRPVTVADSIRMTRLADPNYIAGARAKPKVAEFSPDGKRFVVVLRRGNLENNTNDYSLLLFRTADVFDAKPSELLVQLASSSNRPAIQRVIWLGDNDTLLFLGEGPGENQQIYRFACSRRKLERLTNHPTNITAFSASGIGQHLAFVAEKVRQTVSDDSARRLGIRVITQRVSDLMAGNNGDEAENFELFVMSPGSPPERVEIWAPLVAGGGARLSPDGRYIVVVANATGRLEKWQDYDDILLRRLLPFRTPTGAAQRLIQYVLIDTQTGRSETLIDAPIDPLFGSELAWSPDSQSVIVTGTYLPLDTREPGEHEARRKSTFVVEVKVPRRNVITFPTNDLRLVRWDVATGEVLFQAGRRDALLGKGVSKVVYVRRGDSWVATDAVPKSAVSVEVSLEEDLNTPPRIIAIDPVSQQREPLLDLNPQFKNLDITRVEHVRWKATDGHEVDGGLYLPPQFVRGQKYPLILQTHGFNPNRFWIDGPWTTSFAAQAFTSRGFVVLQVNDWPNAEQAQWRTIFATLAEGPYQMAALEGAIDHLDGRGLIDRSRVGLIGFSRSCFYVKYTLTHSQYKFAAATVADGIDGGYFQYVQLANGSSHQEFEGLNGGPPFGKGLSSWLELSPSFSLDKVRTPIRIEALGAGSLLFEWEWFAGLSRLGRPVDMIYIPESAHILEKPWDRLISQEGNVDWFSFWLKGEEDSNPEKAQQYSHWRKLRQRSEVGFAPN